MINRKLILPTESRIHGDVYVRFGGRYGKTYRRKATRRSIPSLLMLLCEKNGYRLPVFCTFNRVIGMNYSVGKDGSRKPLVDVNGEKLPTVTVNKGEKSFPIFLTSFTVVNRETKDKIKYEDYRKLSEEEKKAYNVYPKLNVYNVFNVAQTNLEQARPELYAKLAEQNRIMRPASFDGEKFSFPAMDEIIKHGLWVCPIKPTHQDQAYYSISRDEIVLPEKSQFMNGEAFYGTAFHEMTHSTGSKDRLDRLKPATFGSDEYAREELVAELGSALVASRYGIVKNVKEDSAAYLKSWLDSLRESPEFIKKILQDVRRAASVISHCIDIVQRQIDSYQTIPGHTTEYPDVYDIDNDGNTAEVVHIEDRSFDMMHEDREVSFQGTHRSR